jgi:hypothetical protein
VIPDWYPDPSDPSQQRFWDGIAWTEHIYGPRGRGTDAGLPGYPAPSAPGTPDSWPIPPDPQPAATMHGASWPWAGPPSGTWAAPGPMPLAPPPPPPGGYIPPGGYGFGGYGPTGTGGFPAPAPWPRRYGPVGRTTSPAIQILLTIVTLGIWALVWTYRQYRDMQRYSGTGLGGGVGLLINFVPYIGGFITFFIMANEVEQLYVREGHPAPVTTVYGLLGLVPLVGGLVWYLLVQRALNDFWIGHGAPPP